MGIICPCGVKVDAFSENNNVKFDGQNGTTMGSLTYLANVCVATLSTSNLALNFVDNETGANTFTFTANAISTVTCKKEGQNCVITVTGTGTINGGTTVFPFEAIFRDENPNANIDNVQAFVITGFFDQSGAAPVAQNSIVSLGCQSL